MRRPEKFLEGRREAALRGDPESSCGFVEKLDIAPGRRSDFKRRIENRIQDRRKVCLLHKTRTQLLQANHGPQIRIQLSVQEPDLRFAFCLARHIARIAARVYEFSVLEP